MSQIIKRIVQDEHLAWVVADEAARHGLRVVSLVFECKTEWWHVYIEAPTNFKVAKLDKWVEERKSRDPNFP